MPGRLVGSPWDGIGKYKFKWVAKYHQPSLLDEMNAFLCRRVSQDVFSRFPNLGTHRISFKILKYHTHAGPYRSAWIISQIYRLSNVSLESVMVRNFTLTITSLYNTRSGLLPISNRFTSGDYFVGANLFRQSFRFSWTPLDFLQRGYFDHTLYVSVIRKFVRFRLLLLCNIFVVAGILIRGMYYKAN